VKTASLLDLLLRCLLICQRLVQEVSSLSVEPCDGEVLIVTGFEIGISEVLSLRFQAWNVDVKRKGNSSEFHKISNMKQNMEQLQ
jgi:hypothetical protein